MIYRFKSSLAFGVLLTATAAGQVWSRDEAIGEATRIALDCGDGPRERLVADDVDYRPPSHPLAYPIGMGVWYVYFGKTIVSVSDGEPTRFSWIGSLAAELEGSQKAPFTPYRGSKAGWIEHGRALAGSLGVPEFREFVENESRIPQEWEGGKFRTRTVKVTLNESGPAFPTITGGNHIALGMDAKTGMPVTVSIQRGYEFDPAPVLLISRDDALSALRALVDLGEVVEVRGPAYMELLGSGNFTTEGRRFKERAVLPLVYSITGQNYHGAVDAGSGKVLRTRRRTATVSTTHSAAAAASRGIAPRPVATRKPSENVIVTVLSVLAASLGLAWWLAWNRRGLGRMRR